MAARRTVLSALRQAFHVTPTQASPHAALARRAMSSAAPERHQLITVELISDTM